MPFSLAAPSSVKDNGVKAIETLMERKGKFDYILLETTGLADPAPIAGMFWMDDELGSQIYLDGVVTVVDAKYGLKNLGEQRADGQICEAVKQVALADVILLNKIDLVEDADQVAREIAKINGSAPVVKTERSKIDLAKILDLHAYDGSDVSPLKPLKFASEEEDPASKTHLDLSVGTVTLRHPSPLPKAGLERFLQALLWDEVFTGGESGQEKTSVLRLKGLFRLEEEPRAQILQGVHDTYDLYETGAQCAGATLVIIGRNLSFQALDQAFREHVIAK